MSIKKMQWIDLSIILLWVLLKIIDSEVLVGGYTFTIIPLVPGLYLLLRIAHILKTKTSFTWVSFASFIAGAILSLGSFIYLLNVLIIPSIIMPLGMGFIRVYFNYELPFILPFVLVPMTIVCCTKVKKYQKLNNNEINFKDINSYEKSSVVINILIILALIAALNYYNEVFSKFNHYVLCTIFFAFALILLIKNLIIILKKKYSNNSVNLVLNTLLIILFLYTFETLVSNYYRCGYGVNYSPVDPLHIITLGICSISLLSVFSSLIFDVCSPRQIKKKA